MSPLSTQLTYLVHCAVRTIVFVYNVRLCVRFIAVTRPIKYARHKNTKRVHVMLALTWIVSVAISSPIAFGMNYTERRALTPRVCTFYNAEFLIYSSMGSFYIPCIVMIILYSRIFVAIRAHARKTVTSAQKPPKVTSSTDRREVPPGGGPNGNEICNSRTRRDIMAGRPEIAVVSVVLEHVAGCSSDKTPPSGACTDSDASFERRPNDDNCFKIIRPIADHLPTSDLRNAIDIDHRGRTEFSNDLRMYNMDSWKREASNNKLKLASSTWKESARTSHLSTKIQKSAEKSASRRERKATKTLAIVLGKY